MRQQLMGTFLLGLATLQPGPLAAEPATDQCEACHSDSHFYVQDRSLYEYYRDWLESPHAASGLNCSDCHGGDPDSRDKASAHAGVLDKGNPEHALYYRNQPKTCGTCHADKARQFRTSKHFTALLTDAVAPTCTTCHRAMNRRPYFRDILQGACATCHNADNPERIPLITAQVREYLQRLNVAKGYLGWTTVHYETLGWPGGSKCEVETIQKKYEEAVTRVHSFDLDQMDQSSTEVLTELKLIFERIWNERKTKEAPDSP